MEDRDARYSLEVMSWATMANARWLAFLTLFLGLIAAAATAETEVGMPGEITWRLAGLVVIAALWALWVRRLRRLPERLRAPLLLLARRCRPVVAMGCAVALVAFAGVLLAVVPWPSTGYFGVLFVPTLWLMIIVSWISRAALKRRMPTDG
ncbi:hypothetical protein [Streptomyces sp. NPDC005336]|uniref:hypothetical protein n=2 Tax=unclassified Streptomyces TaxID=2593676 RepID=UPI0033BB29A6